MGCNLLDHGHEAWGDGLGSRRRKPVQIERTQKINGVPVDEEETARRSENNRTGGTKTRGPIVLTGPRS